MADFNLKFGRQAGAAIEQLSRKLELMFNANPRERHVIPDLDIRNVRSVFPVLIGQDLALRSPMMNWKARQVFDQEFSGRTIGERVTVKPLSLMTIEELEFLLPYLEAGDLTMVEVLSEYTSEYRAGHYEPHENFASKLLKFINERRIERRPNTRLLAEYDVIHEQLLALF